MCGKRLPLHRFKKIETENGHLRGIEQKRFY